MLLKNRGTGSFVYCAFGPANEFGPQPFYERDPTQTVASGLKPETAQLNLRPPSPKI